MENIALEKIGFTKGEVKVYYSLLELGSSTSGPIIIKSRIARSKVYDILEKLKHKGLVSEIIKENTKYFQAASPERIMDYIREKEKDLKKEEEEFKKILPELLRKQKEKSERQEVKVYVGIEGVKTYYLDILNQLKKGDEYLAMTFSGETLDNSLVHFFQDFHKKRAEKGAIAKILSNDKKTLTERGMNFSNTKNYEFRNTNQILPTGIAIIKDTVATFNWGKTPRVFAIICKENASQYRKFFCDIWNKAKE
jgi:sugar-specific transcriptional regulator TrmB